MAECQFITACHDTEDDQRATMQPLKMIVPGSFWDSQIYSGRLYLFGTQGDIVTLDWDRLITEWGIDGSLQLAMQCAFCRSEYLYGDRWALLFKDSEVKNLIQRKFTRLANTELMVSPKRFEQVKLGQQDTPFPFPHADSTIYNKEIFVASTQGVHSANCEKKTHYPISTRADKHWDAPVLAISASYNSLALAAGDEGLYELPLDGEMYKAGQQNKPLLHTRRNCIDCRWTYYSIYGSSHIASGYLASYVNEIDETTNMTHYHFTKRKFERYVNDQQIFHSKGYSWGTHDKLCQAIDGAIHIVKYNPWKKEFENRFKDLGVLELAEWKGNIVSGGTALFGIIIECDNALVIVPSEGQSITLTGEPVNWRIFPKSKYYENQLHIIYEDRIEILSFNHDYFVDQKEKRSGIRFRNIGSWGGRYG